MIIKGLSNEHDGIIVYSGDTEPCAVYVDGNIVENVSCIPTVIEGNPIQYSSEYKQNLFKLQIDGNTEQQTYAGKNLALATEVYSQATEVTVGDRTCVKFMSNIFTKFTLSGGFKENTRYTISFDVSVLRNTNASQGLLPMVFFVKYKDTATDLARDTLQTNSEEFAHKVKTTLANKTIDYIGAYGNTDSYDVYIDINTFMLQEGAIAEPVYEPYVGGIPSPHPGKVTGTPASPIINVTDTYKDGTYDANEWTAVAINEIVLPEQDKTYRIWVDEEQFEEQTSTFGYLEIHIGTSLEQVLSGSDSNGVSQLLAKREYAQCTFNTIDISENFYIGVGNTYDSNGISSFADMYWEALKNIGVYIQTEPYESTLVKIPAYPQPINNAGDNGMSLELRSKNLFDGNQEPDYIKYGVTKEFKDNVLTLKSNVVSANYRFKIPVTTGKTYTVSVSSLYMSAGVYGLYIGNTTNQDKQEYGLVTPTRLSITFKATTDILYIKGYVGRTGEQEVIVENLQIEESPTKTPYEPYFAPTTIQIPPSVTVDGTTVSLRFSIYDKIIVDRLSSKVTYLSGTWYTEFNGNESFYQNSFADSSGYGRYYVFAFDIPASGGYCTHFRRVGWLANKTVTNVFSWVEVNSTYNRIAFKTDGNKDDTFANSLAEFKALLKSLYNAGTPVTVLAKLKTPTEYVLYDKANNITTDLGQALLNLANSTQNATNILTTTSTPSANLLVNYARWGGRK